MDIKIFAGMYNKMAMYTPKIYESWKNIQRQKYESIINILGKEFVRNLLSGRRVLDLGIGFGYFEDFLEESMIKSSIIGLDRDEEAARKCRVPLVIGNANRLPFRSGTFDVLLSIDSFHSVKSGDFVRVLKRKGLALITMFFNDHSYEKVRGELKEKLVGFDIVCAFELHGRENEYVVLARKL